MPDLNLLPSREVKKLEVRRFSELLGSFAIWILFFLIIFSLFLSSIIFYLSIILKSQSQLIEIRKNDEKTQYLTEIEDKTKELNKSLVEINLKQKEIIIWTLILEELSKITPNGVYLTNFSYQASFDKISLRGFADTREDFLDFHDKLGKSACFSNIEAPLSNLIRQDNVEFVFNFKPMNCSFSEDSN